MLSILHLAPVQVFPRFSGTGCMFFRTWCQPVFPRSGLVTCFPAFGISSTFLHTWQQFKFSRAQVNSHIFPCLHFPCFSLIGRLPEQAGRFPLSAAVHIFSCLAPVHVFPWFCLPGRLLLHGTSWKFAALVSSYVNIICVC